MNKVILMGRLTSNPKMDWTRSEDSKQYATYTLAVNRRFKRNGEQEADFINCVAWGAMAEFAEKYMKKGAMFAVVGRLNVRSWEKDGERHWATTVIVEECYFTGCTPKKDGDTAGGFAKQSAEQGKKDAESKPAQSKPVAQTGKQMGLAEQEGFYPIDEALEDDDLPF